MDTEYTMADGLIVVFVLVVAFKTSVDVDVRDSGGLAIFGALDIVEFI
jgi:hypothetical protein